MDVKIIQQREVDIEGRPTNILNYLEITIEGVNEEKVENVTSLSGMLHFMPCGEETNVPLQTAFSIHCQAGCGSGVNCGMP